MADSMPSEGKQRVLCSKEERIKILNLVPQAGSFRFIDSIDEMSDEHIVTSYHFRGDEWFYSGHFPGDPVTPGVIMIETMAQAALVAHGLYFVTKQGSDLTIRTLFAECAIEFVNLVPPGSKVTVEGEKIFFRRNKLKTRAVLKLADGTIAASGTMAGVGVSV